MASKELFELNGGVPLTSAQLSGEFGLHVVDPVNGSRPVTLNEIKTWFSTNPTMVPSSVPWRGARVALTAPQSIANTTTAYISWASAPEDTDSFWSGGSLTEITVGPGITRLALKGQIEFAANGTGQRLAWIERTTNGGSSWGSFPGYPYDTKPQLGASTPVPLHLDAELAVAEGHKFRVAVSQSSGGALNVLASDKTWLTARVLEASI